MNSSSKQPNDTTPELIQVGTLGKPYGLVGEIRVKPETHDLERHSALRTVFVQKHKRERPKEERVRASRRQGETWFLKFEGKTTPEEVKPLSGSLLLIDARERLPTPEGMVYHSDLVGLTALDEEGETLGMVTEIQNNGGQDLISVRMGNHDLLVPWNDHFVQKIEIDQGIIRLQVAALRGLYED